MSTGAKTERMPRGAHRSSPTSHSSLALKDCAGVFCVFFFSWEFSVVGAALGGDLECFSSTFKGGSNYLPSEGVAPLV